MLTYLADGVLIHLHKTSSLLCQALTNSTSFMNVLQYCLICHFSYLHPMPNCYSVFIFTDLPPSLTWIHPLQQDTRQLQAKACFRIPTKPPFSCSLIPYLLCCHSLSLSSSFYFTHLQLSCFLITYSFICYNPESPLLPAFILPAAQHPNRLSQGFLDLPHPLCDKAHHW